MTFVAKFAISYLDLNKLNNFLEQNEIYNFSIFEDNSSTPAELCDENGFPVASKFFVDLYCETEKNAQEFLQDIKQNFEIYNEKIQKISNNDWITKYENSLQPVKIGNFIIYHQKLIPIKINAALAFGSGSHQTTSGCILMMDKLKQRGFMPKSMLDMGCGSGILSICAAKIWPSIKKNLGIDIDENAVNIAMQNYADNNVECVAITGCNLNKLTQKFDLIVANILKTPLEELASDFYTHISNSGFFIASGYITSQEGELLTKYKRLGFNIVDNMYIDDWCISLMNIENHEFIP